MENKKMGRLNSHINDNHLSVSSLNKASLSLHSTRRNGQSAPQNSRGVINGEMDSGADWRSGKA